MVDYDIGTIIIEDIDLYTGEVTITIEINTLSGIREFNNIVLLKGDTVNIKADNVLLPKFREN